ncbi:MAG: YIP1 family protein [Desulfovibrionales bacterium]
MAPLIDRMIRAAKLDIHLYEEVEADKKALGQAMTVVVISSLAAGIGTIQMGVTGLLLGTFAALAGWFLWALIIYVLGAKLLPEAGTRSSVGELLRTTGFASAPGVIRILGVIPFPFLRGVAVFVASIWMLLAMIIAVRQALDYKSSMRTVGVCLLGWIIQALLLAPLLSMLAPTPAGP